MCSWRKCSNIKQFGSNKKKLNPFYLHEIKAAGSVVAHFRVSFELIDHTLKRQVVLLWQSTALFQNCPSTFLFLKRVRHPHLVTPGFLFPPVARKSLVCVISLQVALFPPTDIRYPFYQLDVSRDYRPLHGQVHTLDSGSSFLTLLWRSNQTEKHFRSIILKGNC